MVPHAKEFYDTLYRQLLVVHRTLAAEKVLVGLEDRYDALLEAVREGLDDLSEILHPRDTAELDRLLQEQKALAQEVTAAVKWANEQKVKP